jgi:hypothetical protein
MEHCISHCWKYFTIFGASKPSKLKGLSAISVISQGNVWDLCTVYSVQCTVLVVC